MAATLTRTLTREQRARAVDEARHSAEMEGLACQLSPDADADRQAWVDGLIPAAEVVARARRRHGLC